jgi:hypothetical protein
MVREGFVVPNASQDNERRGRVCSSGSFVPGRAHKISIAGDR